MADLTPQVHFAADVEPNYQEYVFMEPGNERKAKNAAISVSHFPEWAFHYYWMHDRARLLGANSHQQLFKRLCQQCPELKLVQEYADAGKHRFLIPAANFSIPTATGAFREQQGRLKIVTTGDYFDDVLTKAVAFLAGWIK